MDLTGDWLLANGYGGVGGEAQAGAAEVVLPLLTVAPGPVRKGCALWVDPPEFNLFTSFKKYVVLPFPISSLAVKCACLPGLFG